MAARIAARVILIFSKSIRFREVELRLILESWLISHLSYMCTEWGMPRGEESGVSSHIAKVHPEETLTGGRRRRILAVITSL